MSSSNLMFLGDSEIEYVSFVNNYPYLSQDEEQHLAIDYKENNNLDSAHKLITSYLRYVVKISYNYCRYGLPFMDIVQEGTVGLMHAVKKFDPYKGYRLSTYSFWWIKQSIQEYIIKSWKIVKVATTKAKRKLFFSLNKIKGILNVLDAKSMSEIKKEYQITEKDILDMEYYLYSDDISVNFPINENTNEDLIHQLQDKSQASQETQLIKYEEKELMIMAIDELSDKEKTVIHRRYLIDTPDTLESIGKDLKLTKQRIKQIENKAISKLQKINKDY